MAWGSPKAQLLSIIKLFRAVISNSLVKKDEQLDPTPLDLPNMELAINAVGNGGAWLDDIAMSRVAIELPTKLLKNVE